MTRRSRVLIDVDGVMADLVGVLAPMVDRKPSDFTGYSFDKMLGRYELGLLENAMAEEGFAAKLPWYPEARTWVSAMCEAKDIELLAVTAASPRRSRTWEYDRRLWLSDYFAPSDVLFVPAQHKCLIEGDFLIEDNLATVRQWIERHPDGTAYLVDRSWNRGALPTRTTRITLQ